MRIGFRDRSLAHKLVWLGAFGFLLGHVPALYRLLLEHGHVLLPLLDPGTHRTEGLGMMTILTIVAATLGSFIGAFVLLRRARAFEDMPTSRIRSAAQGYIELQGHAQLMPGPAVISPLSRQHCVWWSYTVRHYDPSRKDWSTVESETSDCLFELADETGICIVDPHGARVTPGFTRSWRGRTARPQMVPKKSEWISFGDYSYSEKMIRIGDPLYAVGQFRTQAAILELDETREISELLAEWKRDQQDLLQRFDSNDDGRIDMQEWEQVRRAAIEQVRAQQVQQTLHPDIHVLSRPRDRRPFILSALSQNQLARRYRILAGLCVVISLLLGVLALTMLSDPQF